MKALEFGGHHVVVEEVDRLSDLEVGDMYLYAYLYAHKTHDRIITFEQAKFFKNAKQDVKILKVVWSYINYTKPYSKFYRYTEQMNALGDVVRRRRAEIF